MDSTDAYIIAHHRSMTQPEIAAKLGLNKSTISRRVSKLKASGEIEQTPDKAREELQQARDKLRGCALSRTDRLKALGELRDVLHAELMASGGASLARVASEYRKCLEEMEALSVEMELAAAEAHEVNPIELIRFKCNLRKEYADRCDRDTVEEIADSVLTFLDGLRAIDYKPTHRILSSAQVMEMEAEGGEDDEG